MDDERDASDAELEEIRLVRKTLLRMNEHGWGLAIGLLCGFGLFLATNWLVLRGGAGVGFHLQLLAVYFPGYRVTFLGSFVGLVYASIVGYAIGYAVSAIYNMLIERQVKPIA